MRPIDLRPYHADVIFADFNNDTWLDFVILDRRETKLIETRAILFMNQGHGVFKPVPTTVSGLNGTGISGEAADLNNDGLVDLLIAADPDNSGIANDLRRYESMVFLNTGLHGGRENHWLRLRFSGITHARLLGARIEVFEPGSTKRLGTRGIYSNHSYKSGSPPEAHFGLGKTSHVDVSVHLPGGEHFTVKNVQGDRYLDLNVAERAVREVVVQETASSTASSVAPTIGREYACRASTTTPIYNGKMTVLGHCNSPELDEIGWYMGNSGVDYEGGVDSSRWVEKQYNHTRAGTHPVGKKKANAFGLCDMIGNVMEWCEDHGRSWRKRSLPYVNQAHVPLSPAPAATGRP